MLSIALTAATYARHLLEAVSIAPGALVSFLGAEARWICEQAHQQMKELGLDHFEGRSWQGP
jgi:hypothetical protein